MINKINQITSVILMTTFLNIINLSSNYVLSQVDSNNQQQPPELTPQETEQLEQERQIEEEKLEGELNIERSNQPEWREAPGPGEELDLDQNVPESPEEEIED
ncbi:MAG: hypothetical protein EA365_02520 [Gloeocapsa sp. DLM2.Bin57]|nr:MAG: hypothetical protein EA365_02520 [Gloeocapsa sp. DLM2.Bin57]